MGHTQSSDHAGHIIGLSTKDPGHKRNLGTSHHRHSLRHVICCHDVVGFCKADLHTDIDLILNQEYKLLMRHPFVFYQMVMFQIKEGAAQILQYAVAFLFHSTGVDVKV